jgi:hypothetical protein
MARSLAELLNALPPERLERVEARAGVLIAEAGALRARGDADEPPVATAAVTPEG